MYYVRRKQKIKGPLTVAKLHELHADGRLRGSDEIGEYREGPWQPVAEAAPDLLGFEIPIDAEPTRSTRRSRPRAAAAEGRVGDAGISWEIVNSSPVRVGAALAIGALVLFVLFITSSGEPEPQPVVVQPEPAAEKAVKPAAAERTTEEAAADQLAADREGAERQAIERLLHDFYNAASWRQRYRFVVQDEAVKPVLQQTYSGGADFGSGLQKRIEITKIPDENTLATFRKRPRSLPVELRVDRRPTTVFVIHGGLTEGWRIDWKKSFDTWVGR